MKIGHAHIKVRDLDAAERFYAAALGLETRERIGRYVFMSGTTMHHEIALQEVGSTARIPGRFDVGLFHVAFEVPDKQALAACVERLTGLGIRPAIVDHRISWALYFSDPDGNGLEIYCDTRGDSGVEEWEAVDEPLTIERLLAARDES